MDIRVSQSRVKTWLRCRQAHYYKYVEKLEPITKSRPLQFGTIVHEMLEAHAEGLDPFEKLQEIEQSQGKMFRSQREELGELIWSIEQIMTAYFEYYEDNPLKYVKLNGRRSEHELEVEIADGIILVMKLDGIVKTENKLRWLLENKTFGSLPSDDDRWRNIQIAVYVKACELLDMKPFDGVCWNYIRSKQPSIPGINQDGSMSRRKCDTLPSVVIDTAEEYSIENYESQLEAARLRIDSWFQRIFTPVSPQVVERVFDDFLIASADIRDHGLERDEKNIDKHCSWCSYKEICQAELTGGDPDFVKEKSYGKRKKRKKVKRKASRKGS